MNVTIFVLLAIAATALFAYGLWSAKKRREALAAFAATRGWTFAPRDDTFRNQPWGAPFGRGSGRRATNVLTGTVDGRPVLAFNYQYTESSGSGDNRRSTTYHWSIFSVRGRTVLPELRVGREGFGSGLVRALGVKDIELESEEFNRTFKVSAADRKFAYDVLHPRMMQWLLGTDAPGFLIHGGDVVLATSGRLNMAAVDPTLAYLFAVVDQVPDFVWGR